jgi:hypothetical protein
MQHTTMSRRNRLAWAVESEVDTGVIDRLFAGKNIRPASRRVLADAARRMNLRLPADVSSRLGLVDVVPSADAA